MPFSGVLVCKWTQQTMLEFEPCSLIPPVNHYATSTFIFYVHTLYLITKSIPSLCNHSTLWQQNLDSIWQAGKLPEKLPSRLPTTYPWHHIEGQSYQRCCAGASRLLENAAPPVSVLSLMAGSHVWRPYTKRHRIWWSGHGTLSSRLPYTMIPGYLQKGPESHRH